MTNNDLNEILESRNIDILALTPIPTPDPMPAILDIFASTNAMMTAFHSNLAR